MEETTKGRIVYGAITVANGSMAVVTAAVGVPIIAVPNAILAGMAGHRLLTSLLRG